MFCAIWAPAYASEPGQAATLHFYASKTPGSAVLMGDLHTPDLVAGKDKAFWSDPSRYCAADSTCGDRDIRVVKYCSGFYQVGVCGNPDGIYVTGRRSFALSLQAFLAHSASEVMQATESSQANVSLMVPSTGNPHARGITYLAYVSAGGVTRCYYYLMGDAYADQAIKACAKNAQARFMIAERLEDFLPRRQE